MIKKICVVTGSRSEYGLLFPILKKIQISNYLELQVIVTTMHLSEEFGNTVQQVEKDGFLINEKIENLLSTNSHSSIAKSTGLVMILLSDAFSRLKPDVVLLLGDRFETLGAASTAILMNLPIAHIHGGELTEGAIDEKIRHAISKMSYLHFCSTEIYRNRIIQMGEDPSRVFNSGAPGIDNIKHLQLLTKKKLELELDWSMSDACVLFTYHSETVNNNDIKNDINSILNIMETFSFNILFTYANADSGGEIINNNIEKFCKKNPNKYKVLKSLGQVKYLSAMKFVDLLIGNSSSGIIEAASFNKPVINIGDRQKGRLKGVNIIDCYITELKKSILLAHSDKFKKNISNISNIYGSGKASDIILDKLINFPVSNIKRFIDKQ